MTKNSLCSCPQTCKLITSWVNSVKTADFQSMHVTLPPPLYGTQQTNGRVRCLPTVQHLTRLQFLWFSPTLGLSSAFLTCHFVFQQPFHGSLTMRACWLWQCCSEVLPDGDLTALLSLCLPFLGQNHSNHSQQACCSGHQLCWHVGFQFSSYTSSTHGQCKEEHSWRQVQAQSMAWFLAFTEPLLFTHNARVEMVT